MEDPGPTVLEIRDHLTAKRKRKNEPGWILTPLYLEVETMIKSGLAHVWDDMSESNKTLIRAYYRQQDIMAAWEQDQAEK